MLESAKDFLTHPWTTASAVLAAVASVFQIPFIDPLLGVVWANAGNLFTVLSVSAFTLAPEIPWLPGEQLTILALLAGALFVLTQLETIADALSNRFRRDQE